MTKHINCHCDAGSLQSQKRIEHQARFQIKQYLDIIHKFNTEDGFEEYINDNRITLSVGSDETEIFFDPRTWDAAEWFCKFTICHLIEMNQLDEFPYYQHILWNYSHDLDMDIGTFE